MQILSIISTIICIALTISVHAEAKEKWSCKEAFKLSQIGLRGALSDNSVACQRKDVTIRLHAIRFSASSGLLRPELNVLFSSYTPDKGLVFWPWDNVPNLYRIGFLEEDGLHKSGERKEEFYLYEDGEQHIIIRCEKHEVHQCVSYPRIEQRYPTHLPNNSGEILNLRISHKKSDLGKFPEYYDKAQTFIKNTDFIKAIECDIDRYICAGKKSKPK